MYDNTFLTILCDDYYILISYSITLFFFKHTLGS